MRIDTRTGPSGTDEWSLHGDLHHGAMIKLLQRDYTGISTTRLLDFIPGASSMAHIRGHRGCTELLQNYCSHVSYNQYY